MLNCVSNKLDEIWRYGESKYFNLQNSKFIFNQSKEIYNKTLSFNNIWNAENWQTFVITIIEIGYFIAPNPTNVPTILTHASTARNKPQSQLSHTPLWGTSSPTVFHRATSARVTLMHKLRDRFVPLKGGWLTRSVQYNVTKEPEVWLMPAESDLSETCSIGTSSPNKCTTDVVDSLTDQDDTVPTWRYIRIT